MALIRKPTARPRPEPDPRTALFKALVKAGEKVASACGVCGGTVRADDPEAVQEWRTTGIGRYGPDRERRVPGWRYHGVCHKTGGNGPEVLALLLLHPEVPTKENPLHVEQAHYDVSRRLGPPLRYDEREKSRPSDTGRGAWRHVPKVERQELAEAVERRRVELTAPRHSYDGRPCGICGVSHELLDAWRRHPREGWPMCGACTRMFARSGSGNLPLVVNAANAAAAADAIPAGREVHPFPLAHQARDYRPMMPGERRAPWAYLGQLPPIPPSAEERLAELERRLEQATGVAA